MAKEVGAGLGERDILLATLQKYFGPACSAATDKKTTTVLRIILGDQLSHDISAFMGLDPVQDIVLMMQLVEETTYVSQH